MAIVYNVQVHPIHAGHVNDHKVMSEQEFATKEQALLYVSLWNNVTKESKQYRSIAVYTGAIDTETGENLSDL
jgi:hypothetical protein